MLTQLLKSSSGTIFVIHSKTFLLVQKRRKENNSGTICVIIHHHILLSVCRLRHPTRIENSQFLEPKFPNFRLHLNPNSLQPRLLHDSHSGESAIPITLLAPFYGGGPSPFVSVRRL